MKLYQTLIKTSLLYVLFGVALFSCEPEPDPQKKEDENNNGNGGGGNTAGGFTPDQLSEFLVFNDADKITGSLSDAPDLQLRINVKDTLYITRGFPVGAKIVVRHDGLHDVSGFYIAVDNSSFYYDVPVVEAQAQDSVDVIYINIDVAEEIEYPLTIPVKIQPYGPDGAPLDEFDKEVTIEDPATNNGCGLTIPFTTDTTELPDGGWRWLFTVGINQSDEIFHEEEPGLKQVSSYQTGGCCNDDGSSSTVAGDPYCFEKYSDTGEPNPRWRSIQVEHYFVWEYDILWFFDNGTFVQDNLSMQTNYRPSKSDFCAGEAGYDFDKNFFHKSGTHDFVPGADYLTITYDVADPPVYGKTIRSGNLQYSCHGMLLSFEVEGQKWFIGFMKINQDELSIDGENGVKLGDWD